MRRSACCMVAMAVVLLTGGGAMASARAAPAEQQANIVHVVGWGETLFSIARRYDTTVQAVSALNGIADPTRIYAGQRLLIPGDDLATGAPAAAAPAGSTHTVQKGENLFRIALRYGTTTQALAELNGIYNSDSVAAGQVLVIPGSPTTPAVGYQPEHAATTHTVQQGDTLSSIAFRNGVTLWTLIQVNSIANASLILPGQVLTIPRTTSLAPAPTSPSSSSGSGGKRIVVDLSEQHVYAYNGATLVYSFVASTGMAGARTAPGTYRVLDKIPMAYASTWDLQMPYWMGIYWAGTLENGFHALPILSDGSLLWAGYLGTPISYGCVVLGTEEARLLFEWAEVGDAVIVQY